MKKIKKQSMTITAEEQYKMMRHADYEVRREYMGDGWERSITIHSTKKAYNRKRDKKVNINNIEY